MTRQWRHVMRLALLALVSLPACGDDVVAPGLGGHDLVYVVSSDPYRLVVLQTGTQREVTRILLTPVARAVTVTPDGSLVYVSVRSSNDDNRIEVIDTRSNRIIKTVQVGRNPWTVAPSPDGRFVYVSNLSDSTVSVIETPLFRGVSELFRRGQNEVVATVKLPSEAVGIAFGPTGDYAYVSCQSAGLVIVIETTNHTVVGEITVGESPQMLSITPDDRKVYVANFGSDDVSIIDTASRTVVGTVDVSTQGDGPFGVVVTPDGSSVYVTNYLSGNVNVIDTATDTIVATIQINRVGTGVAMAPQGDFVYVTGLDQGVTVIQTATNTVARVIAVAGTTNGITVGPALSR